MAWWSARHFLACLVKNKILTPLDICLCASTTRSFLRHSLFVCHIIADKVSQKRGLFISKTKQKKNEVKKARKFWSGIQDFKRKKSHISLSACYRKSYGCCSNECKNEEFWVLEDQNLGIFGVLPQAPWGLTAPPELQQLV